MFTRPIFWWANLLLIIVSILLTVHVNCYCEEIRGNRKVRRIVNAICGCLLFANLMPFLLVFISSDLLTSRLDDVIGKLFFAGLVAASIVMAARLIHLVRKKQPVGMILPALLTFVLLTVVIIIVYEVAFAYVIRGWNMPE